MILDLAPSTFPKWRDLNDQLPSYRQVFAEIFHHLKVKTRKIITF